MKRGPTGDDCRVARRVTDAYRPLMPTEFPGLLLWGVPGIIVWLAGQVLVYRAFIARRERSLSGLRLTMVGMGLSVLGPTVPGVVAAPVRAECLVAPVVALVPAPGAPFDAAVHQLLDGAKPVAGALVGDVLAPGYTFQGRVIRLPVVAARGAKPTREATPRPQVAFHTPPA